MIPYVWMYHCYNSMRNPHVSWYPILTPKKTHNKSGMTPNTNQTESKKLHQTCYLFTKILRSSLEKKWMGALVTWFSATRNAAKLRPGRTSMSSRLARYMDRAITLHHSTVAKVSASGDVGLPACFERNVYKTCVSFLTYRNILVYVNI